MKTWKAFEIKYIREQHLKLTDKQMAASLGRTPKSVQIMRIRLRLTKTNRRDIDWYEKTAREKELNLAIRRGNFIEKVVSRMRELIKLCENAESLYIKDRYKKELKHLSGLS